MSILEKITMRPLATDQYMAEEFPKTQIYLHHTAGAPNPQSSVDWWASTPERVATAFVVGRTLVPELDNSGSASPTAMTVDLLQTFSSKYWAHHLGLTRKHLKAGRPGSQTNTYLNQYSIGIEICNWGGLTLGTNGFKTYTGKIVPDDDVVEYPTSYKGFKYFEKYTDVQLDLTKELLAFLCNRWNILSTYKGDRMFDVCADALQGKNGIWTHTSVRPDKSDCHPQPSLISMLKSL